MNLSGKLPEEDANGLAALAGKFLEEPDAMHVVIAIIDVQKLTTSVDTKATSPTLRIRRIEPLLHNDLGTARRLLERAFEMRTGKAMLPIELEDELEAAFEGVEPDQDGGAT